MFDEFGVYPASVIRCNGRIRAYYGGWTRCSSVPFNVAIGCAESKDEGKTFTRLGLGPVLSYSPQEPFILSGPKVRFFDGKWYLFYIAGSKWLVGEDRPEPVYRIRYATSDDGINWAKANLDIIESALDGNECQASPDVFFDGSLYHMFFCFRYSLNYRNKERGYRIGYAFSHDLVNWRRNDSMAGIDVGPEEWDSEMVSYPHVFDLDGTTYMLYLGNQVGRFGFGLAQLDSAL
jgi:sucrose-6-phosphate hydrolase SacC (GH32 family)